MTIDVPVEGFSRLVVSHSFEVNVTVGEQSSLTLRIDDNVEPNLRVGVEDYVLSIGLQAQDKPQ